MIVTDHLVKVNGGIVPVLCPGSPPRQRVRLTLGRSGLLATPIFDPEQVKAPLAYLALIKKPAAVLSTRFHLQRAILKTLTPVTLDRLLPPGLSLSRTDHREMDSDHMHHGDMDMGGDQCSMNVGEAPGLFIFLQYTDINR